MTRQTTLTMADTISPASHRLKPTFVALNTFFR